ncbi:acetyltransferase [Desulfovibrio inopinatus]|uniref:acetyltransferase n=1 Tax=Desulfovibrio inopinatus TaxID=102109 RepID=UPI0005554E20|nr:acetyltransferase [Desulfovibrio inopinatus]
MADIVVFGAGQIADVARVYIDMHGPDRIVAFTVDAAYCTANTFAGRPLVPWEELERHFPQNQVQLLGPLSFRRLNEFRQTRYLEGLGRGYTFTSFIHPECKNYAQSIGDNCFILEGNTLQPFVTVGNNVIIWSNNHIGHHTSIEDHCFLTSVIGVSSNVSIGEGSFICGGALIDYGVRIGARSFVGFGTHILKNLPSESVVPHMPQSRIAPYSSQRMKRLL